jgi:hypothetical protein
LVDAINVVQRTIGVVPLSGLAAAKARGETLGRKPGRGPKSYGEIAMGSERAE